MEKIFKTLLIVLLAISAVLVLWGVFATPDKPATAAEAPAIGYNLVWGYILLGAAVIVALFSAAMGLVTKPAGLKGALISLVAIVAIVVIASVRGFGSRLPDRRSAEQRILRSQRDGSDRYQHPHHLCGYGGCRYRGYLFGCC